MNEIDAAIKKLAERAAKEDVKPHEAMQLAQAALNFAQTKAILKNS
jgi:hypothetical protein